MDLEVSQRWCEILIALAILQASFEHIYLRQAQILFALRAAFAILLFAGWTLAPALSALWLLSVAAMVHFDGPYNGGADKMVLLGLTCLTLARIFPHWAELSLAYWAFQLVLSYVVSGWVKVRNPEWRSGQALTDVFAFSAYPVCETFRGLSNHGGLLRLASLAVILFEVSFPIALLNPTLLIAALSAAALFHVANAVLFGLNRFLWAWFPAFPALIWLQNHFITLA